MRENFLASDDLSCEVRQLIERREETREGWMSRTTPGQRVMNPLDNRNRIVWMSNGG